MPDAADIAWFKQQFHTPIEAAVAGTPFDLDMMTALACQETGEVWPVLRRVNPPLGNQKIVALCVGDVLDAPNRSAFPKTKADLIAVANGQTMFDLAHQALVDMAAYIKGYQPSAKNPNKFVHGYGVWQYDLQYFKVDPDYFLQRTYEHLENSLGKGLAELAIAQASAGLGGKTSLTDYELACVAIAYNTGRFDPKKGLRQGYYDKDADRYYGEYVYDYIKLSRTVSVTGTVPLATPGVALVADATPLAATGPAMVVETMGDPLRLRSEPSISDPPEANVVGQLPNGQPVRVVDNEKTAGFLEIEASVGGALLHGFAAAKYLKPAEAPAMAVAALAASPTPAGIVAVYAPVSPGVVTRRRRPADAHSLNEPKQPGRQGTAPAELVAEMNDIIDWLAVDDPKNLRYQPHDGLTFCNIHAHDFCYLSGAYLPRVWWTSKALIALSEGQTVQPVVGQTVDEMRANDLFRWLRDFGPTFGWRRTGTLTKLQQNANQGGLGIIVARRTEDGKSGHIVAVVPESVDQAARRDAEGNVIAPVQSQAGSRNFRRGTGTLNWWNGAQFAESAFWIHP
jgi:hypothetical protein